jgi:uncharacterized protein YjbI with pentapeptide repeats
MKSGFFPIVDNSLNFQGQNLKGKDFQNQNLRGANFQDANLEGAHFEGAILENTNFKNANLNNVIITDAKGLSVKALHQANFKNIYADDPYNKQVINAVLRLDALHGDYEKAVALNKRLKAEFFNFIVENFNQPPQPLEESTEKEVRNTNPWIK